MSLPIADLPLFAAGTAALLWFSRKSLRKYGSHGFYRFFAWEAILALCVLHRQETGSQIVSESLLQLSLVLLALSYTALVLRGRASAERGDGSFYAWERTTTLITRGIYRLIRHPMYASLLALNWGMFFRAMSPAGFVLALLATYFLQRTAIADEQECLAYFGDDYRDYMKRTRRFIPFVY
ncbi:MAG: isoprenylcysteine carboxylmethyltransferase family protein [Zoogloeaceae bacterium]|nr:isoprenylcysteine carboxylmethyltransferase family protein [Zoogloeaceae bacterium]